MCARLLSQRLDEEWVRQEAHVQHDVRVRGRPVLEPERDHADARGQLASRRVEADHAPPKIVHAERGRVDDEGRPRAEGREALALQRNPVEHGHVGARAVLPRGFSLSQRVGPTRAAEAPQQRLVRRVQKQHVYSALTGRSCRVEEVAHAGQERPRPHVEPERHPVYAARGERVESLGEHGRG